MHLARRSRPTTRLATLIAAAALVAACGTDDDTTDDPPEDEQTAPEEGADPDDLDVDDLEDLLGEQEDMDLPDPSEQVEDGVFRGVGITMPAPEGFELDPMALAQGTVIGLTGDGLHTLAGQAVDTAELPEGELDFEQLVDGERESLGGDPSVDEEVDLNGADRAHLLRFDELPAEEEGQPVNSLLAIIADDGSGQLAMFNYLAPTEDYSDDTEELLLSQSGFDPDSEPVSPMQG